MAITVVLPAPVASFSARRINSGFASLLAVARKLAAELTGASKLQADLFLRPNDDGLFPGFSQTWRAEG